MKLVAYIIYAVVGVLAVLRIPKILLASGKRLVYILGTLLPSTYYLVAQDKNTRQLYVITDIHSSPFDAYDFRATVRSESDRIYIAFDNASLYVCSSDFIYNCSISHNSPYNKAKMIRFCDLPNNTLNLAHKVMLLDAIYYDKFFKNMSSLTVPKKKCPSLTKRA